MAEKIKEQIETTKEEKKESALKKIPTHNWAIATYVLGILSVVLLVMMLTGNTFGLTGNVVSQSTMEKQVDTFVNTQLLAEGGANITDIKQQSGLYVATVSLDGESIPLYFTKDGKFISPGRELVSISTAASSSSTETTATTEVPKSDKPIVEAYIFSYCPYGTQFEKALVPAYNLLKSKADINIVAIGAMHGEYEHIESLRQVCIEKNYGRDKLFSYLKAFNENAAIGSCSGKDTCVNPLIQTIFTSLSIDKAKIDSCMAKDAEAIYSQQNAKATSLGIGGSPTFVINGVQVQVSRTPEAIKQAICNAYNTAPSECSQTLSTSSPSAGFGGSTSSSASTGAQC
ncbi:MAG: thioredoxin domain-containing protein [Candidatus Pacearchaeota archaeon]|jgi:hypothetical protein